MDLRPDQVERVYRDIVAKRRAAERGLRRVMVEHIDLPPAPYPPRVRTAHVRPRSRHDRGGR